MAPAVADVVVDGLLRAGTPRLFAVPGDRVTDAIAAAAGRSDLPIVAVAGEGAACVMAAVTAEHGDAPGAALVAFGHASQAIVDGAAHAARDRAPVVIVSDCHEDAALLSPVTKATLLAEPGSAAHWIAHAAQLALSEPRGPVHLQVPRDAVGAAALPVATACRPAPPPPPDARAVAAAARALGDAAHPLLALGLECRAADAKWLRALAEALPAPVLVTPKAKGVLPDPHPLSLGLLADPSAAGSLRRRADLVVAIGLDPAEVPPGAWPAATPVLRVARVGAAAEPGVVAEVIGDLSLVLEELAPRVRDRARADWDVAELDRLKRAARGTASPRRRLVEIAREMTVAGTIAAVDVIEGLAWQAIAPGECLVATGLATPGFALPAAIAASLATVDRHVLAFAGAAGLRATAAEMATAARLGTPVIVVMLGEADLAAAVSVAARAAGIRDVSAATETAFRFALEGALGAARPTLIDAHALRAQ
jgi:acetolactate synthase I/II/III large subunit